MRAAGGPKELGGDGIGTAGLKQPKGYSIVYGIRWKESSERVRAHLTLFHSLGAISWWVATACASLVRIHIATTTMLFFFLSLSKQLYLDP